MKKFIVALCLLLVSLPALSKQPLTTEKVGKWLDSMQAMDKWSHAHPQMVNKLREQAMSAKRDSAPPSFKRSADAARAAGVADQVEAVIRPFGFASLDDWSAYGDRVMSAFMALNMRQRDTGEMMRKQMEALEKDSSIPAAQKQAIQQQMKQMRAMMTSFASVPKADVEAVRPLLPRFEAFGRQKMQRQGQ